MKVMCIVQVLKHKIFVIFLQKHISSVSSIDYLKFGSIIEMGNGRFGDVETLDTTVEIVEGMLGLKKLNWD